jgi:hypothetical protein
MHEPFVGNRGGEREITVPDRPLLSLGEPAAATKPSARLATPPVGAAKPASAKRAKAAARAGADSVPPRPAARSPSWVRTGAVRHLFGKRALYGLVAGTGAFIGIAALAMQFYARQTSRVASATRVIAAPAPVASAMPATSFAALAQTPPAAVETTRATPALLQVTAAPSRASAVPARPAPPTTMPAPTAAAAPGATLAPRPGPPGAPPVAAPAPPEDLSPPATATERQMRCTEILQKASLERITPAETNFFKRECK